MPTATNSRTGSFGPTMQIYGLILGGYITMEHQRQVEQVFGAANVLSSGQYPHVLLKLDPISAKYKFESKLPELCVRLHLERIDVIDMSDWTVREFVLDAEQKE